MQITNVRYVKTTISGAKIRSNAAGSTIVATLSPGDLMYDVPDVSTVKKALNGTTYTWVKVYAYSGGKSCKSVCHSGWIALENTKVVSTTIPSKSSVVSKNEYLMQDQSLINARYIYNYFDKKGWSRNAILGMLGNMEQESSINSGKWQGAEGNTNLGYGLTQWTKATKLINWAGGQTAASDIDKQLSRITYETEHEKEQWVSSKYSPEMTFLKYTTSTKSRDVLTCYFYHCYENNDGTDDAVRKSHAAKWDMLIGYLTI